MSAGSVTTAKKNETAVEKSEAYVADDSHTEAYEEIKAIDAQIEALKAARAELIKPIRKDMEDLEVKKIVGVANDTMFSLTTAERTTLDSKAIKEAEPTIYAAYAKTSEVKTFKVM